MTPSIHHLKSVWEIHLSLIRFNNKVFPCVVFESMLPNHWSCLPYGREQSKPLLSRPSVVILSFCVGLPCVQSLIVTCSVSLTNSVTHFVTSLVLSTSAHYPESRLRNYSVPWSLHASMESFSLSTVGLHH
jgi:hypothetical protein